MLKLRRGRVTRVEQARAGLCELAVELDGAERAAVAYPRMTGPAEVGDEVLVNTEAADLGLGSGGFDVVHANLTRGLDGEGEPGAAVMKLNYTALQHAVAPLEEGLLDLELPLDLAVLVLPLHGQLAPAAFAAAQRAPGASIGYVHTAGGALPAALSRTAAELRTRDLLAGAVSAGPAHGADHESVTTAAALQAAAVRLGWDAVLCAPGPGVIGSGSALGHGGLEALDSVHAALALGARTLLGPRLSAADGRERHRGISHHTATVLRLLLGPVELPLPAECRTPALETALAAVDPDGRHPLAVVATDELLDAYARSGLPADAMGRALDDDPDFFRAGLAAGARLGELVGGGSS